MSQAYLLSVETEKTEHRSAGRWGPAVAGEKGETRVRERTMLADVVRHALQTYAERRHLTPCPSSPEDRRQAVPSTIRKAMEPPALFRAYRG